MASAPSRQTAPPVAGPMEGLVHWAPALEALSQPPPEVFDRLSPLHALVKTLTGTRLPVVARPAGGPALWAGVENGLGPMIIVGWQNLCGVHTLPGKW